VTETQFVMKILETFEKFEYDYEVGKQLNGDVHKIYVLCKKYLSERGLNNTGNNKESKQE